MAYMNTHTTAASFQRADAFGATVDALRTSLRQWALYRRTIRELSELSNRELADLGLNHSTLRSEAYASVHGA